jgi:hypothetical protein
VIRYLFRLFLICAFSELPAAHYLTIDSTAVISVQLSSTNHNRIGIIGDRIKKAYFKSSNISVDVEEGNGQLFVQSMRPNCPPTTISLVSSSGLVQELELCFSERPSEIIFLQINNDNIYSSDVDLCQFEECLPLGSEAFTIFVEGFLKGQIPDGYVSIEDEGSSPVILNGLRMQKISRVISDNQIIFVYRIQNCSKMKKCVKECQVNILDGDWVFLDRYQFSAHECGLLLIGCIR